MGVVQFARAAAHHHVCGTSWSNRIPGHVQGCEGWAQVRPRDNGGMGVVENDFRTATPRQGACDLSVIGVLRCQDLR